MTEIVHLLRVPVDDDATAYQFGVAAALESVPLGLRRHDAGRMRDFATGFVIGAANVYEKYHGAEAARAFFTFLGDAAAGKMMPPPGDGVGPRMVQLTAMDNGDPWVFGTRVGDGLMKVVARGFGDGDMSMFVNGLLWEILDHHMKYNCPADTAETLRAMSDYVSGVRGDEGAA